MLYQIGTLALDTHTLPVDDVDHSVSADFAVKPIILKRQPREFAGEGEEKISLHGQIVPSKLGGLADLETAQDLCRTGRALPVMRGDGKMMGWFVIESVRGAHRSAMANGVGFTIGCTIDLARTEPSSSDTGIVRSLLSLFDGIGG